MRIILLLLLSVSSHAAPIVTGNDLAAGFTTPSISSITFGTTTAHYDLIVSSGITPTATCTAGTPVLDVTSNDQSGSVAAGSLATACTITFGKAWPKKPRCICANSTASIVVAVTSVSQTAFTCTGASAITGDTLVWICWGSP